MPITCRIAARRLPLTARHVGGERGADRLPGDACAAMESLLGRPAVAIACQIAAKRLTLTARHVGGERVADRLPGASWAAWPSPSGSRPRVVAVGVPRGDRVADQLPMGRTGRRWASTCRIVTRPPCLPFGLQ